MTGARKIFEQIRAERVQCLTLTVIISSRPRDHYGWNKTAHGYLFLSLMDPAVWVPMCCLCTVFTSVAMIPYMHVVHRCAGALSTFTHSHRTTQEKKKKKIKSECERTNGYDFLHQQKLQMSYLKSQHFATINTILISDRGKVAMQIKLCVWQKHWL